MSEGYVLVDQKRSDTGSDPIRHGLWNVGDLVRDLDRGTDYRPQMSGGVSLVIPQVQYGIVPPSTGNMVPVMLRPASDANRTATAATSSTRFGRLMADS